MTEVKSPFREVSLSLADFAGAEYVEAVCEAQAVLWGADVTATQQVACERVDCYPTAFHQRLLQLLPSVGESLCQGLAQSAQGATSQAFIQATQVARAPLNGLGWYRVGENGRLTLITKSEHYHAPLGHAFPGYQLLDKARQLGIPNATHNNTRGHLTRTLEEELVRAAHGLSTTADLAPIRASRSIDCVNRVLNLETGSIAVEGALKMILARFYRVQDGMAEPLYQGRIPVFLVMGNDEGGPQANYHGTTTLTQLLRGMWPEFTSKLAEQGLYQVCTIRPNNIADVEAALARYEQSPYKLAGFFHEIVMMNYGARLLRQDFLQRVYELCAEHDIPTVVDEIQSGVWASELFLFREYGLQPTFVAVGKGFPGGEYPASRLLFSAAMDTLPQFGALVTNGQEELASLAYLITMRWAQANADITRGIGDYYESRLRELAARYPRLITAVDGQRHLCGIAFTDLPVAKTFVQHLTERGLDLSAQTYKADCPPVVLTKLPLVASREVVDFVVDRMAVELNGLNGGQEK